MDLSCSEVTIRVVQVSGTGFLGLQRLVAQLLRCTVLQMEECKDPRMNQNLGRNRSTCSSIEARILPKCGELYGFLCPAATSLPRGLAQKHIEKSTIAGLPGLKK